MGRFFPAAFALALFIFSLLMSAGEISPDQDSYIETGDLDAIVRHGELRILLPPPETGMLPRRGDVLGSDLEWAHQLARQLELDPVVIRIRGRDALLRALAEGRGDLVLARLPHSEVDRQHYSFSEPMGRTRQMLVVRKTDVVSGQGLDLSGRRVLLGDGADQNGVRDALERASPGGRIVVARKQMDTMQRLALVADGQYDATVAPEDRLSDFSSYAGGVQALRALTEPLPVGWAMRRGSLHLKREVDRFLRVRQLTADLDRRMLGDLDSIRERKVLRVLTRNNAVTTYLHRGEQLGFEFELAREFARSIGCRIQLVIPRESDELIPWLLEGRGDMIAASLTSTAERARRISFTRPYLETHQKVVVRSDEGLIKGAGDLAGRSVTVRPSSSYHESLRELWLLSGIPFHIEAAAESLETEELIAGVASGKYDVTVADSHILDVELTWRDDVRGAFDLGPSRSIAWAVRPGETRLLAAANRFLARQTSGTEFFNVLRRKYFEDHHVVQSRRLHGRRNQGRISPYDEIFKEAGLQFGIDWRLLAAQAFQESRFDPAARSWAGASGLMQLMPVTAMELRVSNRVDDPAAAIRAGATYLRRLADRFNLPPREKMLFALGAYNAGAGHILDARRIARQEGIDPDMWFGGIEKALPLLSRSAYAQDARYGYCRCQETVDYVREIHERYRRYVQVVQ